MQHATLEIPNPTFCWKTIGIEGDRSCHELREFVHCRNCRVYSNSSRALLNQPFPPGYQDDWAEILAEPLGQSQSVETVSLAIFRLQQEWFALPAHLLVAVTEIVPIRSIPQRSNEVLLGLANVQGELHLCVSVAALLGIRPTSAAASHGSTLTYPRMVIIQLAGAPWVFPVDDMYGIERFELATVKPAPANVSQFYSHLTQGVMAWRDRCLSYLDETLLTESLQRRALS
jgi:chemotaxis-related protein WspD